MMRIFLPIAILLFSIYSCNIYSERMLKTGRNYPFDALPVKSSENYKIEPFDKLSFRMLTNKGSNLIESSNLDDQRSNYYANKFDYQTFLVDKNGVCFFPKIGKILIKDLTINQAREKLSNLYSKFYVDPFIQLKVINRRVIIFTAGSKKGTVLKLENDKTTLIEAIAMANGLGEKSKARNIKLIRGDLSNPSIYKFDLRKMGGLMSTNFLLEANDIIYIDDKLEFFTRSLSVVTPIYGLISTSVSLILLYRSLSR